MSKNRRKEERQPDTSTSYTCYNPKQNSSNIPYFLFTLTLLQPPKPMFVFVSFRSGPSKYLSEVNTYFSGSAR